MIPFYFEKPVYARRRKALSESLHPNRDLLIFFTASEKVKTHDNHYFFQPDNSFLYLTGFAEPESAILIWREKKGVKIQTQTKVFCLPRDREKEQWNGYRYGIEGVQKEMNTKNVFEIQNLSKEILNWLMSVPSPGMRPRIMTNAASHPEKREFLVKVLDSYSPPHRLAKLPVEAVFDYRYQVENLRLAKDKGEIDLMRKSCEINVKAHLDVMHSLKPGMRENQIQGIVESSFLKYGASGPSYSSICASGSNATILHYNTNLDKISDGDLFLIDAGCQYKFYCSDITRTLPANGKFTREQRILMDIVSEAQQEVFRISKPGYTAPELHKAASLAIIDGLKTLKILKGSSEQIFKNGDHKRYYPHGTGHWLGLDVHDANPYFDEKGRPIKFSPGVIFTVEPGIYFMKDDDTVGPEWRGLGVRIEDDILITARGHENLTEGLPRTADEIEKEMKRR
jgi:Xaa-Pro aminopeptidase